MAWVRECNFSSQALSAEARASMAFQFFSRRSWEETWERSVARWGQLPTHPPQAASAGLGREGKPSLTPLGTPQGDCKGTKCPFSWPVSAGLSGAARYGVAVVSLQGGSSVKQREERVSLAPQRKARATTEWLWPCWAQGGAGGAPWGRADGAAREPGLCEMRGAGSLAGKMGLRLLLTSPRPQQRKEPSLAPSPDSSRPTPR